MQPAVDDQERLPARLLAVDDAGDVDAALADDVAAELDDDARVGQARGGSAPSSSVGEVLADRGEVERLVLVEVRDAEAAAEVEVADRRRRAPRRARSASSTVLRCASQRISALRFCEPAKTWKPRKSTSARAELGEQRRHLLGVDAELLRAAAHPHPRALDLEVRVDPHGDARPHARGARRPRRRARASVADSSSIVTPAATAWLSSARVLPGPGEADAVGRHRRVERDAHLAGRGDVEASRPARARCCTTAGIGFALTA